MGRACTQGARTRAAGHCLELAFRPFSPSPAHSNRGARSVAAVVAAAQLPWPPPSRETLPPLRPLRPTGKGLSVVSRPSLPHPAPSPVWSNRQEASSVALGLRANEGLEAGRAAAGAAVTGVRSLVGFLCPFLSVRTVALRRIWFYSSWPCFFYRVPPLTFHPQNPPATWE